MYNIGMGRRRVNWTRRILGCVCVFCLIMNVVTLVATIFTNNEDRVRSALTREMADYKSPVIELKGGDTVVVAVGDDWVEPGVDVYDDRDIPEVTIESMVDTKTEGEYKIHYFATDASSNCTEMDRIVKVVQPVGRIYLTFDDGPGDSTAALLDVLKKYGVRATFFVTGYGDDALIKREYDEGHAVGIHTFSHVYSNIYTSVENYIADFDQVKNRITVLTGHEPKLMRFPGGSSNLISARYDGGIHIMSQLANILTERGFTFFDWNVDSGDAGGASSADEVYNNVIAALKTGGDSVILQHDIKPYSVEAVERIIQYGLSNNYVFSKLDEHSFAAHHGVNN